MNPTDNQLLILWTSDNKEAAVNMVFMYAKNSKIRGWWPEVTLLIWGPSAALVTRDNEIQNHIQSLQQEKVRVIACRKCAENYNIVPDLEKLGIEVFYTGEFLTNWLNSNKKLITI